MGPQTKPYRSLRNKNVVMCGINIMWNHAIETKQRGTNMASSEENTNTHTHTHTHECNYQMKSSVYCYNARL